MSLTRTRKRASKAQLVLSYLWLDEYWMIFKPIALPSKCKTNYFSTLKWDPLYTPYRLYIQLTLVNWYATSTQGTPILYAKAEQPLPLSLDKMLKDRKRPSVILPKKRSSSTNRSFPSFLCLCFKPSLGAKRFLENDFELPENKPVSGTNFLINGFARKLFLTQRQNSTRKWPIQSAKSRGGPLLMINYLYQ